MSDDGDTPPPHRTDRPHTETNLQIPIDIILRDIKRDMAREFKDVRSDLTTVEAFQTESRFAALKQDQQIETNASDLQRVRKHIESVDIRVVRLEEIARDAQTLDNAAAKSALAQVFSGGASTIGSLIAAGIGALIVWILTHYFKGTPP